MGHIAPLSYITLFLMGTSVRLFRALLRSDCLLLMDRGSHLGGPSRRLGYKVPALEGFPSPKAQGLESLELGPHSSSDLTSSSRAPAILTPLHSYQSSSLSTSSESPGVAQSTLHACHVALFLLLLLHPAVYLAVNTADMLYHSRDPYTLLPTRRELGSTVY